MDSKDWKRLKWPVGLSLSSVGASIIMSTLVIVGCNLWGGVEKPEDPTDVYQVALAKMNQGDCVGARDLLNSIDTPEGDDRVNYAFGWTYFCLAGATAPQIASSLYTFTSGSTDLTGIGHLARSLVPMNEEKMAHIDTALSRFGSIHAFETKQLGVGIANFVKAAAILAHQSSLSTGGTLVKGHIAQASTCSLVSDCNTGGCVVTASGTISDQDISTFANTISAAANALGSVQAADLQSLANAINAELPANRQIARCFIFKDMIPD